MSVTLIGWDSKSFASVLAALGERAWSCFCDKHGFWAISLVDDVGPPEDIPSHVEKSVLQEAYDVYKVVECGEMTFDSDAVWELGFSTCNGIHRPWDD